MKTISIANFKGGTGKTDTACNLAAMLARDGKRVLLIDADAQHNATDFFCAHVGELITLADILLGYGGDAWFQNVTVTGRERLDLVPADMRLLTLDLNSILYGSGSAYRRFADFIDAMGQNDAYDYVLIDCPPSFTAASVAALGCSDEVILPTMLDAYSIAGVRELIQQAQSIARTLPPLRFRVLITMADRSRLSRQGVELLRSSNLDVCKTVIHNGVAAREARFARQPLYEYAPKSRPAQDYEELLREVFDHE